MARRKQHTEEEVNRVIANITAQLTELDNEKTALQGSLQYWQTKLDLVKLVEDSDDPMVVERREVAPSVEPQDL